MSEICVKAGKVKIGGGNAVSIQSMTNTDTADVSATKAQIKALVAAGCDIVRLAVRDMRDVEACKIMCLVSTYLSSPTFNSITGLRWHVRI